MKSTDNLIIIILFFSNNQQLNQKDLIKFHFAGDHLTSYFENVNNLQILNLKVKFRHYRYDIYYFNIIFIKYDGL